MMDWSACTAVERDPEKVSGSWVFRGTRVPVVALFENLEGGATVSDFLSWFPGVTKEQVEAVLEYAIQSLQPAYDPAPTKRSLSRELRPGGEAYGTAFTVDILSPPHFSNSFP